MVVSTWPGGGYHQQQVQHAGGSSMATVKWRMSQFMSPECNYRLRARVDAEKPPSENIPQVMCTYIACVLAFSFCRYVTVS